MRPGVVNDVRVSANKKIIYRFPGKAGVIKETTFDIPSGTTSYPFLNLVVSLNAYMRLEHGPRTPDIEEVRVTDNENGDIIVEAVEKPRLEIFAISYNRISPPRGSFWL